MNVAVRAARSTFARPASFSTAAARRYPRRTREWTQAETKRLTEEVIEANDAKPWYQDDAEAVYEAPRVDAQPLPTAPSDLPAPIAQLFVDLVSMPHLDPHSVTMIDTKSQEDDGYVAVCTMAAGRERTFRGASDLVKSSLQRALHATYEPRPKPLVRIEGLRYEPINWVMLDGGTISVHLMTSAARATWDIEANYRATPADSGYDRPEVGKDRPPHQ